MIRASAGKSHDTEENGQLERSSERSHSCWKCFLALENIRQLSDTVPSIFFELLYSTGHRRSNKNADWAIWIPISLDGLREDLHASHYNLPNRKDSAIKNVFFFKDYCCPCSSSINHNLLLVRNKRPKVVLDTSVGLISWLTWLELTSIKVDDYKPSTYWVYFYFFFITHV